MRVIRWLGPLGRVWAPAIIPLHYYICGCDAHFVIHCLAEFCLPCVCLRVRSDEPKTILRGGGTPATFGFEAEAAQLPSKPPPPPPPFALPCKKMTTMRITAKVAKLVGRMATSFKSCRCCEVSDEDDDNEDHSRRYVQLHVR